MIERFEVGGLKELESQLLQLEQATAAKVLRKAGRDAMAGVQFVMARGAGFDPQSEGPHMREEIKLTTKINDKRAGGYNALAVRVGPTRRHSQKAIAQEYGTEKQTADPFMRQALYENREQVVLSFKTSLAAAIEKAVRRRT